MTEAAELPLAATALLEEWMRKITALKGCGARSVHCAREPKNCECWASAKAAVSVLFGINDDDLKG